MRAGDGVRRVHAIDRLERRYGLSITYEDLVELALRCQEHLDRLGEDRARLVRSEPNGIYHMELNLAEIFGVPVWIPCVFSRTTGQIVTFLPWSKGRKGFERKLAHLNR